MRKKFVREGVDTEERVVQRNRGDAQDVRLAPVADDSLLRQEVADGAATFPYLQRQLGAALRRVARSQDGKLLATLLREQKFEVSGEGFAFCAQALYGGFVKDFH